MEYDGCTSVLVLAQINCIPVELRVCGKDLQFRALSNHSDWGTFSEPKCILSCIFLNLISIFRKVAKWFIICPKHMYICDFVPMYEGRENASFSVR